MPFCQKDGISPVYAASRSGRTGIVDLLVNAGADIHLAAADSVSQINNNCLDVRIPTILYCGDVPLGIAIRMGHVQTVERLLKANANVNYMNKVDDYISYSVYVPEDTTT